MSEKKSTPFHAKCLLYDSDRAKTTVFRAGDLTALFLRETKILEDFLSDSLARSQDRDSRRIAHDAFCGDLSDGRIKLDMFGIRVECFLRGKHYGRSDIAVRKRHERCFSEVTTDLGKRAYEAFDLTDAVADRKVSEAVSEVAKLHLDIVFITKKVIHFDAG